MSYYFSKTLHMSMEDAIAHVTSALARKGFGVLTAIDVRATLKKKLDVDFRPYTILGACNPTFAHKALQSEDKIGTMLPCNVIDRDVSYSRPTHICWAALGFRSRLIRIAAAVGTG